MFTIKAAVVQPPSKKHLSDILQDGSIPVSNDPCRTCANPCDIGHQEYPRNFDVDFTGNMLGSCVPYARQVLISTGKSDWAREITDVAGSLAAHLSATQHKLIPNSSHAPISHPSSSSSPSSSSHSAKTVPGVWANNDSTRLSIINSSNKTISHDNKNTCIVLPDYTIWTEIPATADGAQDLWKATLDPSHPRGGSGNPTSTAFNSYPLPFHCVIMLCSHKRRDNRCAVAAPKLQDGFCDSLERRGWEVHTELLDEECLGQPLAMNSDQNDSAREEDISQRLKELDEDDCRRALILKVSHIGGHKYAGNVIIYTPQGSGTSVWYGRVTPHEVDAIVQHTILEGKVLPQLLRGGMNLGRRSGRNLLDW